MGGPPTEPESDGNVLTSALLGMTSLGGGWFLPVSLWVYTSWLPWGTGQEPCEDTVGRTGASQWMSHRGAHLENQRAGWLKGRTSLEFTAGRIRERASQDTG